MILEYTRTTRFPTTSGNVRVRVDEHGRVFVRRNLRGGPAASSAEEDPADPDGVLAKPRKRIEKLLSKHKFFNMQERYESPTTTDGQVETLTYVGQDGATRTVTVDRVRNEPFRRLINKLLRELGVAELLG
jgi:hypothetical protein